MLYGLIIGYKYNVFIKTFIYIISIIIPIFLIIINYKKVNIFEKISFYLAKLFLTIGYTKKSKIILINSIEKNQNNYDAHRLLAEIYEHEGGIRKSIDEYVLCIDINKKDYDSYYKIAILLSDLEKKDEAREMLQNLLEKKPDYYNASLSLGDLLIEKEDYKDAVSVLLDAINYNPGSFELNYELGIAYTMLNDFKSAKEYYEKCAKINSLIYNPKYSLAQIAMLYKDLDLAEKYFQETIDDEELSADSYYELSKINLMKGQKESAIKYANLAIDLNSKKIAEKIKNEPLFITILTKLSIPFNLEEKKSNLTNKEIKAKEHLENTSDITINMGYTPYKKRAKNKTRKDEEKKNNSIELLNN